jgi:hypothetical protein
MADEIRPTLPIAPTSPLTPPQDYKRRERRKPAEMPDTEAEKDRNDKDDDSGNLIDEYV